MFFLSILHTFLELTKCVFTVHITTKGKINHMIKIYGVNDELLTVEENEITTQDIECNHRDVRFYLDDGTTILFQYSVKRNKVWTATIEEEGYGEYDFEEYEEGNEIKSDIIEIDAELLDYELVD